MGNIRIVSDIIEYLEKEKLPGAPLFVDFKKAFDSREWKLMHKALSLFGFRNMFRDWVKVFTIKFKVALSMMVSHLDGLN